MGETRNGTTIPIIGEVNIGMNGICNGRRIASERMNGIRIIDGRDGGGDAADADGD